MILILKRDRKVLGSSVQDHLFQFTCLSFGLSCPSCIYLDLEASVISAQRAGNTVSGLHIRQRCQNRKAGQGQHPSSTCNLFAEGPEIDSAPIENSERAHPRNMMTTFSQEIKLQLLFPKVKFRKNQAPFKVASPSLGKGSVMAIGEDECSLSGNLTYPTIQQDIQRNLATALEQGNQFIREEQQKSDAVETRNHD